MLCNEILHRLKMKNRVKIYFTVLRNQFLRSHNEENSVKIYSIALCSEVFFLRSIRGGEITVNGLTETA